MRLRLWTGHRGSRRRVATSLAREVVDEAGRDRVLGLAAETAFFSVLSLFPGLLIATGLLSLLGLFMGEEGAERVEQRVTETLDLILTEQASDTVEAVEGLFDGSYGGLLTFASLGALVTISGAWAVLVEALNLAYNTEERRSWWRRRLLGLALGLATVLVVVVALAVVVVGPLFGRGEQLADFIGLGKVFQVSWDLLRLPLLFATLTAWLMLVYHVAPNRRTPWNHGLPGALATAVLWLVATIGFHLYLRIAGGRNPVLGAFGGGAIVMMWVYLLSVALLLGGELNEVLARRRAARAAGG
jgi:membrane protein